MSKQVEQIRAEIERRRMAELDKNGNAKDLFSAVRLWAYTDLLGFIDALTKEDGPKKPYFDKEYIESKIKAFSEAHKGETAEQIEAECRGEEVPLPEETHSLRGWAQILATNPNLRAEFDKMCPPQPIQGSIAPEADVNRWAVTHAFLHCDKAGKIVSEMYGDKFNNQRNIDKYLAFLKQVELDDRFGELGGILLRYGAMPAPKEQPEADLVAEIDKEILRLHTAPCYDELRNFARHFAEWGAEHLKK